MSWFAWFGPGSGPGAPPPQGWAFAGVGFGGRGAVAPLGLARQAAPRGGLPVVLAATAGRATGGDGWTFAFGGGCRAVTEYRTPGVRVAGADEAARTFEFLRDRIAESRAAGRPLGTCVREACATLLETYESGAFDFLLGRGALVFAHVHLQPLAIDGCFLGPFGLAYARNPRFLGRLMLWCAGEVVGDEHF